MAKEKNPHKLVFLLGAGASIPAGMPTTSEITKTVLSAKSVVRPTGSQYIINAPPESYKGTDPELPAKIQEFLKLINAEIRPYCVREGKREPNYEDLSDVAYQIAAVEAPEVLNPCVEPFVANLKKLMEPYLKRKRPWGETFTDETLYFVMEIQNYIRNVLVGQLCRKPCNPENVPLISQACNDPNFEQVHLFTLNHDLVLECYLQYHGIGYCDGFGKPINHVRYWDLSHFESNPHHVQLVKLHGSVNWANFRTEKWDRVGISLKGDPDHHFGPSGESMYPLSQHPLVLIGTASKTFYYLSGIYEQLQYLFSKSLHDCSSFVVCGYGFGDMGINRKFFKFCSESTDRKAVVISPHLEWIEVNCGFQPRRAKISLIPKRIENVTWEEVAAFLDLDA